MELGLCHERDILSGTAYKLSQKSMTKDLMHPSGIATVDLINGHNVTVKLSFNFYNYDHRIVLRKT